MYTYMRTCTHAHMQMCIANLVEPGDKVVVGNAGIWGERVAEMTRRFRGGWVGGTASVPRVGFQDFRGGWVGGVVSPAWMASKWEEEGHRAAMPWLWVGLVWVAA